VAGYPACRKRFEASNYFLPQRPEFRDTSSEFRCPHCSHTLHISASTLNTIVDSGRT
jgi:hypothetical protein